MAADTGARKIERDTVHHLARIATAIEQIADTLKQMHAADPMAMIQQAVAAEAGKEPATDPLAHIPESERYRFR